MRTCNMWTKLKKNPTRSNGVISILGNEEKIRDDIRCCMRTLIIDSMTLILYGLNIFFIYIKKGHFHIITFFFCSNNYIKFVMSHFIK